MHFSTLTLIVLQQPFQRFILRMNDGREFTVPHPEWIYIDRRSVMVIDPVTNATTYLEPLLIASVHFVIE